MSVEYRHGNPDEHHPDGVIDCSAGRRYESDASEQVGVPGSGGTSRKSVGARMVHLSELGSLQPSVWSLASAATAFLRKRKPPIEVNPFYPQLHRPVTLRVERYLPWLGDHIDVPGVAL